MDELIEAVAPRPDRGRYQEVADEADKLVIVLGSEVNVERDESWHENCGYLPDDRELARYLAEHARQQAETEDLAEIAQRVRTFRGDGRIFPWLRSALAVDAEPSPVHTTIARLPELFERTRRGRHYPLIVTPKYDLAPEHALKAQDEPYDVAVYVTRDAEHEGHATGEPCFVHLPHDAEYLNPRDGSAGWSFGPIPITVGNEYGSFPIVNEPTDLAVATAMRGVAWHTIRIIGAATHAGTADSGRNPVGPLPRILEAIGRYDTALRTRTHPLIGAAGATVTDVRAGVEHNAVPDVCEIVVSPRMIPGETPEAVRAELTELTRQALSTEPGYSWSVRPLHRPFTPVDVGSDSPFAGRVVRIAEQETGREVPTIGTPYGSDVRNLVHDAGIEAITFGAGDVRGCHCPDEHLPVADLRTATVITRVAAEILLAP